MERGFGKLEEPVAEARRHRGWEFGFGKKNKQKSHLPRSPYEGGGVAGGPAQFTSVKTERQLWELKRDFTDVEPFQQLQPGLE
ncbi:unnamed protein product [Caretta caretta]